jgi:tRNA 2-thiouridine synthesizing protein A
MEKKTTLDLSGLLCPLPVLKARKRLSQMQAGELLYVIATDPMAAIDMPHFCTEQGHLLLATEKADGKLVFTIKKAPSPLAESQP